jgi:hypothetical protein
MSRRHYRMLPDGSYLCVSCRQEFTTRQELSKHYGTHGTCKHPIAVGMHLHPENLPYRWTRTKPSKTPVRPAEAA